MPEGAVLCVQCGYNARTGTRIGAGSPRGSAARIAFWVGGFAVAMALVLVVFKQRTAPPPPPALAAQDSLATPASENPAPALVSTGDAAQALTTSLSSTAAVVTATSDRSLTNGSSNVFLEKDVRAKLSAQLDERFPIYKPGDSVALRRANGLIHRGEFRGLDGTNVVLMAASNRIEAPVDVLDQPSRLRCDPAYRIKWLEYTLQRQMERLKNP
ncbi:MAG TPA: hypothetical protein DCZ95_03850 [Verrucomicrobia bacterium]|nr:hypothetical protein [Verrucomicrobiota bacterium]